MDITPVGTSYLEATRVQQVQSMLSDRTVTEIDGSQHQVNPHFGVTKVIR